MIYNIKEKRVKAGLTQEKLAAKACIARATLSKLESGEEVEVKMTTLLALAKALDCPVTSFFYSNI